MSQGNSVLGASFLRSVAPYLAVAPLAIVLIAGTRGFGSVVPFVLIQNIGLPLVRPAAIGALIAAGVATERSVAAAWGIPWVIAAVIACVLVVALVRRVEATEPASQPGQPIGSLLGEFWSFSGARAFGGVAEVTLVWLDVLLVGWLVGPIEAAIYAAASRFVTTGTLALQATRLAITPRLSGLLTAGRTTEAEALFNGGAQAVVASSWPLYLGLACFSPVILRVFGGSFTSGATALTILSLAMLVDTATGNVGSVLLMAGSSRWNVTNACAGLAVDVGVDLWLIPDHGATGAAIGWAAAICVINLMACLEVHYLMHLQIFDRATIRTALVAALCFGLPGIVLGLADPGEIWPLVTWGAISVTAYVAWWWRRRNEPDVHLLLDALGVKKLTHSGRHAIDQRTDAS
jgi:O-antigen/teichoic acid export membrane protein